MPTIELIYDADCPNIDDARESIRGALAAAGQRLAWRELDRANPAAPAYVRNYGSPTVLVDGRDVAPTAAAEASACRIYLDATGRRAGVPSSELIRAALESARPSRGALGSNLASLLPAIGMAALPKLTCPACWPAYAGLLSAMGLGFVDYTPWLLPLTTAFLVITLISLVWRASRRRGYGPFALGLGSSVLLLVGRFAFDSDAALWVGVTGIVAASVWNSWPKSRQACPACEPA